jgi:hypothetical protein
MAGHAAHRELLVALATASATAGGLIALTPWPWTITVPASLLLGAVAVLADILFVGQPQPPARWPLVVVGAIAGIAALS